MTEIQPKTDEEIERLRQEFEEIKMERLKEQFKEIKAERLRTKLEKTQNRETPEEIRTAKKTSVIVAKIKSSIMVFVGVVFVFLGGFFLGCLDLFVFPAVITPTVLQALSYLILGLGAFSLLMGLRGFTR